MPTPTFRWANVQCGGNLAELIATMTDAGLSPDKIAARLYADHGVDVTGRTIARWLPSVLPADDGPSAA